MEKFFSFIILLIAAVMLAPGCMAEDVPVVEDLNTTDIVEIAEEVVIEDVEGAESDETTTTEVAPEEEAVINTTFMADVNVTTLAMKLDETVLISLAENPTTGYMWNVTNSTGLEIVSDSYAMDEAEEGMVGVGGVHSWVVKAVETGEQTFTAVMMHVADEPTGEEETYTLSVMVEDMTMESVEEPAVETTVEEVVE